MHILPGWFVQNDEKNTEQKVEQPQQGGPKPGQRPGEGWYAALLPIGLVVLLIFMLWLPQRRQQRERDALMNTLSKGDEVLTHGGIMGTVVSVAEKEDEVVVEVDKGVRLRLVKAGIIRNYTKERAIEEAAKKPAPGGNKQS